MAIHQVLTANIASITDLKRDPMGTVKEGAAESGAIAILNRNEPAFYCLPLKFFNISKNCREWQKPINKIDNHNI